MRYNKFKLLTDEELKELNEELQEEIEQRREACKNQAMKEMKELINKYERLGFQFVVINENRYQQVMVSPQNLEVW